LRILQRYFLREMTVNFVGVTVVLFAILFVYQVGAVLARAAQLQYPRAVVLELMGLGAMQNVALLLPIGLLLGIVLALGRLHHDSEMAAAQACGIGAGRLYVAVWALALPVVGLIVWLNFDLGPRAAAQEAALRTEALREGVSAPLEPGKFRTFSGGATVVYARATDRAGELLDVFIKRSRGAEVETTVARRARYALAGDGETELVILLDGERMEGVPGTNRYRIMRFEQEIIPVRTPQDAKRGPTLSEMRTAQLLGSTNLRQRAELHWRMGLPIMALVLTAVAVPLGRLRPRQGRYAHVWQVVLVYALYANLATAARAWLERGKIPPALGLWWVHAIFLLFALLAMYWPRWRHATAARRARASRPSVAGGASP
jgi:lipopolysaccharide export system permease protein